jgi:hypothetical protein
MGLWDIFLLMGGRQKISAFREFALEQFGHPLSIWNNVLQDEVPKGS